jgi:dolichol kinase
VVIALAKFVSQAEDFIRILKVAIILATMGAIFMLVIFQFWQHAEGQKIRAVEKNYSSLFREIRKKKSRLEANVHHYILLTFMILVLLASAFVNLSAIDKIS